MRRSTVLSLNRMNGLDFFVKNKLSVFLCGLFGIGVAAGVFSFSANEAVYSLGERLLAAFLQARSDGSFIRVFLNSFSSALIALLAAFLCGGSLMGIVLSPMLVAWNGFALGTVAAMLCAEYALKGVAFNAVVLIPPSVIFLVCYLSAARHAVLFSSHIARLTLPKNVPMGLYVSFKEYCARFAFSALFCILSALVDAVLSCALLKYFDFSL